jgi:cytochrome P450
MTLYGPNLVTTEGEQWKFYRKVTSRTFSQKNFQLVHSETYRQVDQMMASWGDSNLGCVQIQE